MEIKGEYRIAAPREKVFAALNVCEKNFVGHEKLGEVGDFFV